MALRSFIAVLGLMLAASVAAGQEVPPAFSSANQGETAPTSEAILDAYGDPLPPGARARLGSLRFRPGGNIIGAALSPDGRWIATGNNSDLIILSDPTTGKEVSRIRLAGGYGASNLAFSPDSKNLAVLGYSPFMQIVAVPSGKQIAKLQVPQPNNNRIGGFAFSGDGKIVAASSDNYGQSKNFVHTWEVATGKLLQNFEILQNSQIRAALSRDGSVLATSGYYNPRKGGEINLENGRTIQLWNVRTGKELRKVKIDRNPIMALALSPDGKTLALASGAATFHLLETETGKELRRFAGRRGHTQLLQFSPDGQMLAAGSADGIVQLWRTSTGERLGLSEGPRQRVFSIAFPTPGEVWALGMEGQALALWDAASGQRKSPQPGHATPVRFVAYAPDGQTLLSGGPDGKICWWDSSTFKEIRTHFLRDEDAMRLGGFPAATGNYVLSRDCKLLAMASDSGTNSIRLLDLASGKVLCDFDAPRNASPASFAFSADNARFAAVGTKGVHVWEVGTGQESHLLPFKALAATNGSVTGGSLVFSPDGHILAGARSYYEPVTGTPLGEIYLWNVDQGTEIACIELATHQNGTMAFSPTGEVLAVPMFNEAVVLFKAASGRELGQLESSQAGPIQALTFSPDGRLLAGAQQAGNLELLGFNGTMAPPVASGNRLFIWEMVSGQLRQEFMGHQGTINCLAFSPDGRTLASGSADTTVLLWDISGKRLETASTMPPEKLEAAWQELAEKNGKRVYQDLMTAMISAPDMTLDVIRKNLQPALGIKANHQQIERLITDLDNEQFAVRVKATATLENLGKVAAPALRKAQQNHKSLEAERRLKALLERLDRTTLPTDELREVRAVEVLEKIGSAQARALLQNLAGGAPQSRLTMEAQAALGRLQAGGP